MRIGSGEHTYEWVDGWASLPDTESARAGWAHHGVAVTSSGDLVAFHQGDPTVLVFDGSGNLRDSWDSGLTDAHGITLVREDGSDYLWIADNGRKRDPSTDYEYPATPKRAQVVKMTLEGRTVMSLRSPDLPVYEKGSYFPTWVAVNEERNGGNGDVWVADGYGENYVHRYDRDGAYVSSINGEEGEAGAFNCPHAIFVDTRGTEAELYVADRGNARVQVYDLEGAFKRSFGEDFLTSPSGFAVAGELMIVAELQARLTVLDADDRLVCYLGANEEVASGDGWPNSRNADGDLVRPPVLEPGRFNSPHGMATDGQGNVYVAEWLIGGRFTKLAKTS